MFDVPQKVICLFDELIARGERIKDACKKMYFAGAQKAVDVQTFEAWRTSCLTLLRSTFGTSSPHHDSFANLKLFDHYNATLLYLGILQSAREDLRKGYFYHKDLMLSVNIFNAFLSRARSFSQCGQAAKAAGLLETVVCEALRKLAETLGLAVEPAGGIRRAVDALLRAGALPPDACDKLAQLDQYLSADRAAPTDDGAFYVWEAWAQKFLYDYLGSRIVIVN